MELKPINRICPRCGNVNYMRIIDGKNVGKLNVKCINCNSYYNYEELLKGDNSKPLNGADRRTMADLISRAAAIDAIVSVTVFPDADYIKNLCQNPANSEDWLGGVCDAINAVEEVNAVDSVPVVHGRWIERDGYDGDTYYECFECQYSFCTTTGESPEAHGINYCPHCGAKMDGERRDDDGKAD